MCTLIQYTSSHLHSSTLSYMHSHIFQHIHPYAILIFTLATTHTPSHTYSLTTLSYILIHVLAHTHNPMLTTYFTLPHTLSHTLTHTQTVSHVFSQHSHTHSLTFSHIQHMIFSRTHHLSVTRPVPVITHAQPSLSYMHSNKYFHTSTHTYSQIYTISQIYSLIQLSNSQFPFTHRVLTHILTPSHSYIHALLFFYMHSYIHTLIHFITHTFANRLSSTFFLLFLMCIFLCVHLWERECTSRGSCGRGGRRSRLPTEPGSPMGTQSWDLEIMTWAQGICLIIWAIQAPLKYILTHTLSHTHVLSFSFISSQSLIYLKSRNSTAFQFNVIFPITYWNKLDCPKLRPWKVTVIGPGWSGTQYWPSQWQPGICGQV